MSSVSSSFRQPPSDSGGGKYSFSDTSAPITAVASASRKADDVNRNPFIELDHSPLLAAGSSIFKGIGFIQELVTFFVRSVYTSNHASPGIRYKCKYPWDNTKNLSGAELIVVSGSGRTATHLSCFTMNIEGIGNYRVIPCDRACQCGIEGLTLSTGSRSQMLPKQP